MLHPQFVWILEKMRQTNNLSCISSHKALAGQTGGLIWSSTDVSPQRSRTSGACVGGKPLQCRSQAQCSAWVCVKTSHLPHSWNISFVIAISQQSSTILRLAEQVEPTNSTDPGLQATQYHRSLCRSCERASGLLLEPWGLHSGG